MFMHAALVKKLYQSTFKREQGRLNSPYLDRLAVYWVAPSPRRFVALLSYRGPVGKIAEFC